MRESRRRRREKNDWLEKKRLKGRGELSIGELIGVEAVGYGGDGQVGVSVHLLANACGGVSPGGVAVHHDDEVRCGEKELLLSGAEVRTEECDCGDADLVEAHDTPWALDDDEAVGVECSDAMEVEEQVVFGQPWREVPLSMVSDCLWIESTCGIAEGPRFEVVESDADGLVEETWTSIEPGLEAPRGLGMNRLVAEEIGLGVEWEPAAERREGLVGPSDGLDVGKPWVGIAGQRAEVVGDLSVGASIESSDELDDIAPGVTSGETSPEVLATRDDESPWIVTAVDGAGAEEGVCALAHSCEQAAMGEDLLDGDESLQPVETQMSRDHVDLVCCFPFPFPRPL